MVGSTEIKSACKLCQAGEIGRLWSKDIILGRKSPQEAMAAFEMQREDVLEHINNHEIITNDTTGNYESPDFYINEILKSLKMLKDWMNYCSLNSSKKKEDVELFIKLNKEIRETLKCLGEFHGRIGNSTSTTVNIAVLNQKYMMLTNVLQTEVCPECRLKVIEAMEQIEIKEKPRITTST